MLRTAPSAVPDREGGRDSPAGDRVRSGNGAIAPILLEFIAAGRSLVQRLYARLPGFIRALWPRRGRHRAIR